MKKAGLLVLVVLMAAVLALPGVFAGLTESHVTGRIAQINEGDMLDVTLDDYSRGWFSSTARLSIRLAPAYRARVGAGNAAVAEALSGALPVVAELAHGPAGYKDGPFLGLSKLVAYADPDTAWVRELADTYGLAYLFEFRGRTGYTGRVSFDADLPPVDTAATGGNTRFSGTRIEGTLTGNHLVAELDLEQLDVTAPGASMLMSDVHAETDSRFLGDSQTTGTFVVEVAELGFALPATPDAGLFQVAGVRLATEGDIEDGTWRSRFDLTAESIVTENGQRIESAALGAGVTDLDAAAFAELQALLEDSLDPATGTPSVEPARMQAALNGLLAGSPSLEIAPIRFTWGGDAFEASVRLDARGGASLDLAALGSNPAALMDTFDGTVDATIAKPLARRLAANAARAQLALQQGTDPSQQGQLAETQASLMLVMLTGQGYIAETDDAYTTALELADGTLTINGRPLPALGLP